MSNAQVVSIDHTEYDVCTPQRTVGDQKMFFTEPIWLYFAVFVDAHVCVCMFHLQPVATKAEDSGRMLQHLQDHLDLQRQQLVAAVLVAAGPALLPGLPAAKQLRTLGSLLSHWGEWYH
jgi:hypothetical protein